MITAGLTPGLWRGAACCAVAVACLAIATRVQAQTLVRGRVVEDHSNDPIATVDIRLIAENGEVLETELTDASGAFQMTAPGAGRFTLSIQHIGYATIFADSLTLEEDEEVELLIRMDPAIVVLDAVTIIGSSRMEPVRIAEFHERAELNRSMGRGRIYMREEIEQLGGYSANELLDGLTRVMTCKPAVLLDGLPTDDLSGIQPSDLEGIEIYRGVNQIPPRYYRYGMCGLALVWTRADADDGTPLTWRRIAFAGVLLTLFGLLIR